MAKVSICVDVSDIKQGTKFYTKALGCDINREEQKSSELTAENVTIFLVEKEENSNPLINESSARSYRRHWTPVHLDFSVEELEKSVSLVQEFGGIQEGKEEGDWGAASFCADPFGNGFCLIQLKS